MKKVLALTACLLLSGLIVFGIPEILPKASAIMADFINQNSLLEQKIQGYDKVENTYHKLYHNGQLVAVITDYDYFNSLIAEEYSNYEEKFPDTELCLGEDFYVVQEKSFSKFENIDKEIFEYLSENNYLGVKATRVEFSTKDGVYDIIFVKNEDDFYEARDQFLINFIDEETLKKLRYGESIESPNNFGSVETNIKISETITISEASANPSEVFTSVNEIYNYLCYGRNTTKTYYITEQGDTLQGVGYSFQDMSAKQIMMLNPDVIFSTDQVLEPGTKLNVTYFSSPITVIVTKERLAQEVVIPEAPEYRNDISLVSGAVSIIKNEVNGVENVLYEEVWINGVLQSGSVLSTYTIKEAERGIIAIGTSRAPSVGTGNWGWPVENPHITCLWGGYPGHKGTDVVNRYNRYGNILASDTGVVVKISYDDISGNYIIIDHQNGYKTYYGHASRVLCRVGQVVERGDVIGVIGMTGFATGPHVHFHMYVDGVQSNVCNIMDCDSIMD